MIKVVTEHTVKEGRDISPLLLELRAAAIQYPGYVSAENLLNAEDSSKIVVVSTWQTLEDWREWEKSRVRTTLYQRAKALLVAEPRVEIYRIMPAHSWG